MLEPFDRRQRSGIDRFEAPKIAGEGVRLLFDALAAQVLEQVVVRVNAVERRMRRMRLVEIPEQVVDEMRREVRRRPW